MLIRHAPLFALFSVCLNFASAAAQAPPAAQPERATVVISASSERVRFAAPNRVARLRLEVLSGEGGLVFEAQTRGSVFDWALADTQGARLTDGAYLCVVTVKDVSGRLSQRLALVEVAGGRVEARPAAASDLTPGQAREVGPVEGEAASVVGGDEPPAATLVTHDGEAGAVTSTAGDLTLRTGDFFAGKDTERVRITSDGRVGIGTDKPEATLDVAGTIRARGGIRFDDGTTLLSAASAPVSRLDSAGDIIPGPSAAGTGTQNRLAKWAETGGAGTLTNSSVTESGGNVGIGTANPAQRLHVFGKSLYQNTGTASLFIVDRTDGKIAALGAGGASATFAYDQSGIFKIESNSRASISQGVFGVATGATTRFMIDGAGNVGIGTEAPAAKLDVAGSIKLTGTGNGITFPDGTTQTTASTGGGSVGGTGTANRVPLWAGSTALADSVISQTEGGNIGVGTTTPSAKLDVAGSGRFTGDLTVMGTLNATLPAGSTSYIQNNPPFEQSASFNISGNGTARGTLTAGRLTVDTDTLHVDATNDRVGIGTTMPGHKLEVIGAVNFTGLRTEATGSSSSPNVIGGRSNNAVTTGVVGATIGGGGEAGLGNRVTDHYGTVGGGFGNKAGDDAGATDERTAATVGGGSGNTASGLSSTVPGGISNTAQGDYSLAAGQRAQALHQGSFVWSDSTTISPNFFSSTAANQFLINAAGGVGININNPTATLHVAGTGLFTGDLTVNGTVNATLSGNGSGLTNLNASNITTGTLDSARLGVVPTGKGGTGLSTAGAAGSFLRSDGAGWTSSALQAADIPAGSGNYIQMNPAEQQNGSFNISGNGAVGGALTAGGLTVDTDTLHVDATNNRVGVGKAAPEAVLDIGGPQAPAAATPPDVLRVVGQKGGNGVGPWVGGGGTGAGVLIQAGDGGNAQATIGASAGRGGSITLDPGLGGAGAGLWPPATHSPGPPGNVLLAPRAGNVGVGTNAPGARLHVSGGAILLDNNQGLFFKDTSGTQKRALIGDASNILHLGSSSPSGFDEIYFDVSTSGTAMTIKGSGNVGVGTAAPLGRLQVETAADTNPSTVSAWDSRHFVIGGPASSGGIGLSYDRTNHVGYISSLSPNVLWRNLVLQSGGGNVGIGTTSPGAKLDVNGSVKIANPAPGGVGAQLCRDTISGIIINCSASSARYKENIFGLRAGLSAVLGLRPVSFTWKGNGQQDIGLVAEEVNRVEPLLNTYDAAGGVDGVRYDRLPVVLVNAVQEQQARIAAQQQTIAELRRQNSALGALLKRQSARLDALERISGARRRARPAHR